MSTTGSPVPEDDHREASALGASSRPLHEAHDLAMLDLDGVVYVGGHAVAHAPESIAAAREAGTGIAFVTNNASRTPERVAAHLQDLGIDAGTEDVVSSAQAAAGVLRERFGAGARVVALGTTGLVEALRVAGLEPVGVEDDADALATGYSPDVPWKDLMRGAVRVRQGLPWVASNTDMTIPTPYGVAPGHGVLVDMLRRFTEVEPVVAGKPAPPLLEETVRRVGGSTPLMIGDRLDTDIDGGIAVGLPTLLVLTGVSGLDELVATPAGHRPTYVAPDLRGLLAAHPEVTVDGGSADCGGWTAVRDGGAVTVHGGGEPIAWWRAVLTVAWQHLDETGEAVGTDGLVPPAAD
ncbi:HAD-IIA family hydrolase [Nocardioides bruguierae]|uniref:HAD-IIA family hydrolase n=1 Tax=Nocardioides bruguierae TaxID=2945102 RepID=A0A9X2DAS8_9ACTN|nr:HAD-IIA family hydrolase [Nocardioides bruguierae]MCM0622428.1 HAD-IIA family hydrolase [Nocardioides bruguierae]